MGSSKGPFFLFQFFYRTFQILAKKIKLIYALSRFSAPLLGNHGFATVVSKSIKVFTLFRFVSIIDIFVKNGI